MGHPRYGRCYRLERENLGLRPSLLVDFGCLQFRYSVYVAIDATPNEFDFVRITSWIYVLGTFHHCHRVFSSSIFPEGMRPASLLLEDKCKFETTERVGRVSFKSIEQHSPLFGVHPSSLVKGIEGIVVDRIRRI